MHQSYLEAGWKENFVGMAAYSRERVISGEHNTEVFSQSATGRGSEAVHSLFHDLRRETAWFATVSGGIVDQQATDSGQNSEYLIIQCQS